MLMHLIGVIYSDFDMKDIIGFRIFDSDSRELKDIPYKAVEAVVASGKAAIKGIKFEKSKKKLAGSNGSFDRYPALCKCKVKNNRMIILATIDDRGYRIVNYMGDMKDSTYAKVLKAASKAGIANGKIVTKGDKQYISAINGTYDNIKFEDLKSESRYNIENVESDKEFRKNAEAIIKKSEARGIIYDKPRVISGHPPANSKLSEIDPDTGMTVSQKLAYTMMGLKAVSPFYYCIYSNLEKVETMDVPTMGVDFERLFFNPDFVLDCSLPKLLFVMKHEVLHIVMKHRCREKGRKHRIWNKACDYFINKVLAEESHLTELNKAVKCKKFNGEDSKFTILLPDDCLYNDAVDTQKDTPETIYEELLALSQQKKKDKQDGDDKEDNGEDNGAGNGSGSSGDNRQDEQDEDGWESEKQMTSGDDDSDDDEGSGDDSENGSNSDDKDKGGKSKKSSGNGQQGDGGDEGDEEDNLIGKKFRGKEIKKDVIDNDIVKDSESKQYSEDKTEQMAESLIRQAVTQAQKEFGTEFGSGQGFVERYIEKMLAPKINWLTLLKNKCTKASQKINTFSAPDKRFRTRNMTLPGPKQLENDALENIKICIDTSGSISQDDLGRALGQIYQLFRQFKAEAEVLYWDTRVAAVYPFKNPDELLRLKPMGGGGTDANCVFKYFEEDKDYKTGRKKKPNIILMFTDGYFGDIDDKYKKYKDTIWVISGSYYYDFKAPFGTKAPIDMDKLV